MSGVYNNKIVFDEGGASHPFIDMKGKEQVSYNLENDCVRNYLNNVVYSKTDIITSSNTKSTTKTKVMPYYKAKAYRDWGSSESAWSEEGRPVVITGTSSGDTITFSTLDYSMTIAGTSGATLVYNLIPRRFYKYVVSRSGSVIKTGFFNTEGQCRMIKVQIPNFRDIGGWKCNNGTISYNKVFRGCGIVGTDAGGYSNLRDAVNKDAVVASLVQLGITHELDLRDPSDNKQPAINPNYPNNTVIYNNITLGGYTINSNTVRALQYVSDVLDSNGKIWLHCHTGADRAGALVAIIQILLGCSIDSVIKEWELTMFNGNGYDQTFLENKDFRTFLFNQYKVNTGKTLKENVITTLKNNKPSGVTNAAIDSLVDNLNSKLSSQTAAILGDSYSAYGGSGPKVDIDGYLKDEIYYGEYPHYPMPIDKIWWAQVAQHFGWNVTNYSWSGCTVAADGELDERIGSSSERVNRLSYLTGGTAPDIIFCELGLNDARYVGNGFTWQLIENAYRTMLTKIIAKYPEAKIYCLNNVQRNSSGDRFVNYGIFNTKLAEWLEDYPAVSLLDVADVFGYTSSGNTVSDNTHPNEVGFTKIANRVISLIEAEQEQEEDEPSEESYAFTSLPLKMRGLSGSGEQGIQRESDDFHRFEYAEFSVNAGDVVQVGVAEGTKIATFFIESSNGLLDTALQMTVGNTMTSGWYSGCYNYQYFSSNPLKTKTINGVTHYYGEYTARYGGKLTVSLSMGDNSTSMFGGAYVNINGTVVG